MTAVFEVDGWREYIMQWSDPYRELESLERETAVVHRALASLVQAGILPHDGYEVDRLLKLRSAIRESFDVPWSAISPRMQHLLYAINAIVQPARLVAVGVFCGYTFISNAGAAVGPGSCYVAESLVGIEIRPEEADRARRNVATIDPEGVAEIVAADGIAWLRDSEAPIDVLYLDADGPAGQEKSIYMDILEAALPTLRPGSVVLAHNAVNAAESMSDFLAYVRGAGGFRASMTMIVDDQGLEVSLL